jgi:pimeloyl-ACP methyl ester carboxylesterase
MLLISGDRDHTVPPSIVHASFRLENENENVTEEVTIPGRGHALTIDHGWQDVADTALAFVRRFTT